MGSSQKVLRVGEIRTRKIETNVLLVKRGGVNPRLIAKFRELRHAVSHLRREVRELRSELHELEARVTLIEEQLITGQRPNPDLQAFFTARLGQIVTVFTSSATLIGTVTEVGTNAVELTESNGDILIIPYSQITAVQ